MEDVIGKEIIWNRQTAWWFSDNREINLIHIHYECYVISQLLGCRLYPEFIEVSDDQIVFIARELRNPVSTYRYKTTEKDLKRMTEKLRNERNKHERHYWN